MVPGRTDASPRASTARFCSATSSTTRSETSFRGASCCSEAPSSRGDHPERLPDRSESNVRAEELGWRLMLDGTLNEDESRPVSPLVEREGVDPGTALTRSRRPSARTSSSNCSGSSSESGSSGASTGSGAQYGLSYDPGSADRQDRPTRSIRWSSSSRASSARSRSRRSSPTSTPTRTARAPHGKAARLRAPPARLPRGDAPCRGVRRRGDDGGAPRARAASV
jgi:hypothetical protein